MKFKTYHKIILSEEAIRMNRTPKTALKRPWIYISSLFSYASKNLVWTCVQLGILAEVQCLHLQHLAQILYKWRDRFLSFCHLLSMSFITNNVIVYIDQIKENTQIWATLENFTVYDIKIGMPLYCCYFFSWHVVELLVSILSWMDESFDRFWELFLKTNHAKIFYMKIFCCI